MGKLFHWCIEHLDHCFMLIVGFDHFGSVTRSPRTSRVIWVDWFCLWKFQFKSQSERKTDKTFILRASASLRPTPDRQYHGMKLSLSQIYPTTPKTASTNCSTMFLFVFYFFISKTYCVSHFQHKICPIVFAHWTNIISNHPHTRQSIYTLKSWAITKRSHVR